MSQSLPQFTCHHDCVACPLATRETLSNPGLPTRPWDDAPSAVTQKHALLVVGSHPGFYEDQAGTTFIGPTGILTNRVYVAGHHLHDVADVYLTNALRCAPRDRDSITPTHLQACRKWLDEDVRLLAQHYQEVVILATGERAIHSIMQRKVSFRAFEQGTSIDIGGVSVPVFATYLAAVILPDKDPSKIRAIREHLTLVHKYLTLGHLPTQVQVPPPEQLVGSDVPDPPSDCGVIALDVETYGYIRGYPWQTVFHPKKSIHWDKVSTGQLVASCALAWRDPDDTKLRTKVYRFNRSSDRRRLLASLRRQRKLVILGQNIPFDVQYLRACDHRFRSVLSRRHCTLYELQVLNFLQNDQRVERSLKNLSLMLSVADYRDEEVDIKRGERYDSLDDPRLWTYNAKDVLATLLDYEYLVGAIHQWYGTDTHKWTDYSRTWYNEVLWLSIRMAENGVEYNYDALQRIHDRHVRALTFLQDRSRDRWDWPLQGDGSGKAREREISTMIDTWAPDPSEPLARNKYMTRVQVTKTGRISAGKENVWLLMGVVPPGCEDRGKLLSYRRYLKLSKVVNSYSGPLLYQRNAAKKKPTTPHHASALVAGRAYPSWHVVPSYAADDDSGSPGGTSQCRITPKDPGLQTHPPKIEDCQRSRFQGGALVHVDESQSEVRVATGLSGDKIFLDLYMRQQADPTLNVHADTASEIVGEPVTKKSHPREYHAGKTLNFLVLFLGQWRAFRETCLREVGWDITATRAKQIISRWDQRHREFRSWQRHLIADVQERGYLEIPLIGASRTFLGQVEQAYASTIVNVPVQAISALLTLSAQITMDHWLEDRKMKSLSVTNTYDEGVYDCPPWEVDAVATKAADVFRRPPLYDDLIDGGYMVDVPLAVEVEVIHNKDAVVSRRGVA